MKKALTARLLNAVSRFSRWLVECFDSDDPFDPIIVPLLLLVGSTLLSIFGREYASGFGDGIGTRILGNLLPLWLILATVAVTIIADVVLCMPAICTWVVGKLTSKVRSARKWLSESSGLFRGKIRQSRIEQQRWTVSSADKIDLHEVVTEFVTDQLGRKLANFVESVRVLRSMVVEDVIHVMFLLERDDSTIHDGVCQDVLNQQVFYLRCQFSSMLQMLKIEHAKHIGLVEGTPVDQDIEMAWSLEIGGNLPPLHSYTSAPRSANPTPVAGPGPDSELGQPVAQ